MNNKKYTICIKCGKVQTRTDILEQISGKYIILNKKNVCPNCGINTKFVATNNIKILKKHLSKSNTQMDKNLLNLIG